MESERSVRRVSVGAWKAGLHFSTVQSCFYVRVDVIVVHNGLLLVFHFAVDVVELAVVESIELGSRLFSFKTFFHRGRTSGVCSEMPHITQTFLDWH